MPAPVLAALRQYWGYDELRPLQAEAIAAGCGGRDSLVVMPTGGGKSLCYQIPAVLAGRVDVVISPLISLMKDQVDGLLASGYPAGGLHSGMTAQERQQVERDLLAGKLRLLFIAPERLQNEYLRGLMQRAGARAFAIDEAHCISHWGHDFRPEYRQLALIRQWFPEASLHAFTATATPRVRRDIAEQLQLRDPVELVGCFDRPNLVYRVQPKQDVYRQVAEVLRRHEGEAAIVYCFSRKDTEAMAAHLREMKIHAEHYHAGMTPENRRRAQENFANEKTNVVTATVAFGMGIDRSDVRCVIHAAIPSSVEHYQQETGRAGRDGLEAECVLFYSYGDVAKRESLMEKSALEAGTPEEVVQAAKAHLHDMKRLAGGSGCRHKMISEYFGQAYAKENCGACDICLGEHAEAADATVMAQKIISCVARVKERYGIGHVVEVLRGSATEKITALGHDQLSTFGLLRDLPKKHLTNLVHQLVDQGLLTRTLEEYPVLRLNEGSWEVLRGGRQVHLHEPPQRVRKAKVEVDSWAGVDRGLFEKLRLLRGELARAGGVAPFVVMHDATLRELARVRPTKLENLQGVHGLGKRKTAEFGQRLVETILSYAREHDLTMDVLAEGERAEANPSAGVRAPVKLSAPKVRAFELFARNTPVAEAAREIGRAESTTWEYLAEFVEQAGLAELEPWVDAETYRAAAEALAQSEDGRLKPVFEALGGKVPYEALRVVGAHLRMMSLQEDAGELS